MSMDMAIENAKVDTDAIFGMMTMSFTYEEQSEFQTLLSEVYISQERVRKPVKTSIF